MAMKEEDKKKRQELINYVVDELRRERLFLLADAYQRGSTNREHVRIVLRSMLDEMESTD